MSIATIRIAKIEVFEGTGECSACGRVGLRWIATLTDGTRVGLECAKKILGFKPAPTKYRWVEDFQIIAEHGEYGEHHALWRHKSGGQTRETVNGVLIRVGGCQTAWEKRGWL